MVKKLPYKVFKSIYTKVPRLCVELVVRDKEGGVLLTLRDIEPKKGFWHLPGGGVLFGETLQQAIKRVAKEELGAKVVKMRFLKIAEYLRTDSTVGHSIALWYEVKIQGKITLDKQASKYGFFHILPKKILKEYRYTLADILKNSSQFEDLTTK